MNEAKIRGADLLIMGRRGLGNVERMFVGSNSTYVVHNAPCSVLVIKSDAPEKGEPEKAPAAAAAEISP